MFNLKTLFALLVSIGLLGCDDRSQEVYVDQPSPSAADTSQFTDFQPNQAIDQLKTQLLSNPEDFDTLSRLADMYFEASQYFEAIQTYDRAIAVNPACADCYNDKGLALFYLGDADGALAALDQANEIDPAFVNAWLSKGFMLVSIGRYEEAIAPLNKVKELDTSGRLTPEADRFLDMAKQATQQ